MNENEPVEGAEVEVETPAESTNLEAEVKELQATVKDLGGKLSRAIKDNKKLKETPTEEKPEPQAKQSSEADYGKLAFFASKGVEHEDDISYIEDIKETTGKDYTEILSKSYVISELKERQQFRTTEAGVPKGTNRGQGGTKDKVEYYLAKGELPPADKPMLRREYVNKKLKVEESRNKFTDNPIGNIVGR